MMFFRRKKLLLLMIQEGRSSLFLPETQERYVLSEGASFGHYLKEDVHYCCHILLDTPPQDFLVTPVPKLSSLDRRRFVQTNLQCRFGDRFIGRGRFIAKTRTLTGWRLSHDGALNAWSTALKNHQITIQSIASLPQEWGNHSSLVKGGPTLVVTLDDQSILRHWYYENNHCLFSRVTRLKGDVPNGPVWQETINRELNLSFAYLEGRGLKSHDVTIVTQTTPHSGDLLQGSCHAIPFKSMETVVLNKGFDHDVMHLLRQPHQYRLPCPPPESAVDHRQRKERAQRCLLLGLLVFLLLCVLVQLYCLLRVGDEVLSVMSRHHVLCDQVSQVQKRMDDIHREPLPPAAHEIAYRHQANLCFWRDKSRFEALLTKYPHAPYRLTDYVWTFDNDQRSLTYDVGLLATVPLRPNQLKNDLRQLFPHGSIDLEQRSGPAVPAPRAGDDLWIPSTYWVARFKTHDIAFTTP